MKTFRSKDGCLLPRREALKLSGSAMATFLAASAARPVAAQPPTDGSTPAWRYCLNTSTIRGQNLTLPQQVEVAAKAGYDAIEPWIRDLQAYRESGGDLKQIRQQLVDSGLTVDSAIGFANWIVDDPAERAKGMEVARRDMDLVREIGGTRIAAPPAGATRQSDLDLRKAAERYAALLELGASMGVTPQLELWGFSQSISRLGELLFVAAESGHPDACLLPDVYHIYKGGSDFSGLGLIAGSAIHVFHMNDYPADPPRERIGDADRVYPGDGIGPLAMLLNLLHRNGFRGTLSLELFNPGYWQQDALHVAQTGLAKMRQAVRHSMAAA